MKYWRAVLRRWQFQVLLAVNLLLLADIGRHLRGRDTSVRSHTAPVTATESAQTSEPIVSASIRLEEMYGALMDRPLFSRTRRWIDIPVEAPVQTSLQPPSFSLSGTVTGTGRPASAFLRPLSGGKSITVKTGELIEGWTVTEISKEVVKLNQGKQSATLEKKATGLYGGSSGGAAERRVVPASSVGGPGTSPTVRLKSGLPDAAQTSSVGPSGIQVPRLYTPPPSP